MAYSAKRKGSNFEITVAKEISLWWSEGRRDDIFCRTITSGAWATTRRKGGQNTAFSTGDLSLLDPEGLPFAQLCAVEMKRGYSETTTVLDFIEGNKVIRNIQIYYNFNKIRKEARKAGAIFPVLIFKKDRKKPVIVIDENFYRKIVKCMGCEISLVYITIRNLTGKLCLYLFTLEDFLNCVKPTIIKEIWEEYFGEPSKNNKKEKIQS